MGRSAGEQQYLPIRSPPSPLHGALNFWEARPLPSGSIARYQRWQGCSTGDFLFCLAVERQRSGGTSPFPLPGREKMRRFSSHKLPQLCPQDSLVSSGCCPVARHCHTVDTGGTEAKSAKNIPFPWSRSRTLSRQHHQLKKGKTENGWGP